MDLRGVLGEGTTGLGPGRVGMVLARVVAGACMVDVLIRGRLGRAGFRVATLLAMGSSSSLSEVFEWEDDVGRPAFSFSPPSVDFT